MAMQACSLALYGTPNFNQVFPFVTTCLSHIVEMHCTGLHECNWPQSDLHCFKQDHTRLKRMLMSIIQPLVQSQCVTFTHPSCPLPHPHAPFYIWHPNHNIGHSKLCVAAINPLVPWLRADLKTQILGSGLAEATRLGLGLSTYRLET